MQTLEKCLRLIFTPNSHQMRLQFTFLHGRPFKVTLQIAKSQLGLKSTKIDSFPVFPPLRKKLFHYLIRHFISTNQFNINSVFFVLVLFQFFSYFFSQPKKCLLFLSIVPKKIILPLANFSMSLLLS